MLKAFCDRCGSVCNQSHTGSRRFEAIVYTPDGVPIGLELMTLFNGQAAQCHICESCFTGMLDSLSKTEDKTKDLNKKLSELTQISNFLERNLSSEKALTKELEALLTASQVLLEEERKELSKWQTQVKGLKDSLDKKDKELTITWTAQIERIKREDSALLAQVVLEGEEKLRRELIKQETVLANDWNKKFFEMRDSYEKQRVA